MKLTRDAGIQSGARVTATVAIETVVAAHWALQHVLAARVVLCAEPSLDVPKYTRRYIGEK